MKVSELLRKGRELISDPKKWTKGAYARDNNLVDRSGARRGTHVSAVAPNAACWCSVGALRHFTLEWDPENGPMPVMGMSQVDGAAYNYLLHAVMRTGNAHSVEQFNDHPRTTHESVLRVWDLAIELAEAEGK